MKNALSRWNSAPAQLIGAAIIALCAGFAVYYPITDADIFWHLASGREMLRQGVFLHADPFSFTFTRPLWINLHWLFQVIVYTIQAAWGYQGLIVFKCAVVAVSMIVLFHAIPGKKIMVLGLLFFGSVIFEARYLIDVRPVILSLLMIASFIWLLERYVKHHHYRYLWALIPLQCIWTNAQGLYAIGIALVGIYWMADIALPWLKNRKMRPPDQALVWWRKPFVVATLIMAGVCLACLVNPYGIEAVTYPLRLLKRIDPSTRNIFSANISENAPLASLLGSETRLVFVTIFAALLLAVSFVVNYRRFRLAHAVLSVVFLILALMAERNVVLFLWVALPIALVNLSGIGFPALSARIVRSAGVAGWIITAGILGWYSLGHAKMLMACPRHESISPFRFPDGATEYLRKHYTGFDLIFNADRYGGYLSWELYPMLKTYIDGRFILRAQWFFAEYLRALDEPESFDKLSRRDAITYVLLQSSIFPRYTPLIRYLYNNPTWKLVYTDGSTVLFCRSDQAKTDQLHLDSAACVQEMCRSLQKRWVDDASIYEESILQCAMLLTNLSQWNSALIALEHVSSDDGRRLRAWVLCCAGRFGESEIEIQALLNRQPDNIQNRLTAARIAYMQKDFRRALKSVIFVLTRQPFNREARSIVDRIKEQMVQH